MSQDPFEDLRRAIERLQRHPRDRADADPLQLEMIAYHQLLKEAGIVRSCTDVFECHLWLATWRTQGDEAALEIRRDFERRRDGTDPA